MGASWGCLALPPSATLLTSPPGRSLVLSSSGSLSTVLSRRSCIVSRGVGCLSSQSFPLCGDLVVEGVEVLSGGAVEVEPPVADEVVLVEEGSVGAEEAVLGETSGTISCADVERLALGLGVRVVTSVHLTLAGEAGLRHLGVDRVVLAWHARDGTLEHGQGSVSIGGGGVSIVASLVSTVLSRGLLVANGRGFLSSTSPAGVAATMGVTQAVPTHKTQGKGCK